MPVARRAGQVDAAATSATVAASASESGPSSAAPGGSSLSVMSRSDVGPEASSAPVASPSAAAGTAMRQARSACAATIVARGKPSERWMPIVASRRWTSACAATPSITPAAPSTMTENATSSASTIPAAWSSSTRTPSRVTKRRFVTPNVVARACCRVTSTRPGSCVHSIAMLTPKRR